MLFMNMARLTMTNANGIIGYPQVLYGLSLVACLILSIITPVPVVAKNKTTAKMTYS
jgi:hypothetical protein